MEKYQVGDKSKALCPDCGKVNTTFKIVDVPVEGSNQIIKGILAGVCDKCKKVVSIPHQESIKIKEQLK